MAEPEEPAQEAAEAESKPPLEGQAKSGLLKWQDPVDPGGILGFSWYETYTEQLLDLPTVEEKGAFALGVIQYGAFGIYPDFEYPLNLAFAGIRWNLDNSRARSIASRKAKEKKQGDG
jgi:hypothetical protein